MKEYKHKPFIYSGICTCGHSYEDHHLGFIMNEEIFKEILEQEPNHPPYLPQECEYYGCNESGGYDADGNNHCHNYIDKDDPDVTEDDRVSQTKPY